MKKIKLYLADGKAVWMEGTIEDFVKENLDANGFFKSGTVGYINESGHTTIIFTSQIIGVEEIPA